MRQQATQGQSPPPPHRPNSNLPPSSSLSSSSSQSSPSASSQCTSSCTATGTTPPWCTYGTMVPTYCPALETLWYRNTPEMAFLDYCLTVLVCFFANAVDGTVLELSVFCVVFEGNMGPCLMCVCVESLRGKGRWGGRCFGCEWFFFTWCWTAFVL
jgi:hypothetical protein